MPISSLGIFKLSLLICTIGALVAAHDGGHGFLRESFSSFQRFWRLRQLFTSGLNSSFPCRQARGQCKAASAAAALLNVLFIVAWTVYVAVAVTKIEGWSGLWWIFVVDALAAGLAVAVAGYLILRARAPDPPAATHVSVTIPPGAVAGQTLTVDAAGKLVQFVVPAGLEAGATVQVPVGTKETA